MDMLNWTDLQRLAEALEQQNGIGGEPLQGGQPGVGIPDPGEFIRTDRPQHKHYVVHRPQRPTQDNNGDGGGKSGK